MIDTQAVRTTHPTGSRDAMITRRVRRAHHSKRERGFTIIELVVATALAAMLIVGLGGVVGQVTATRDVIQDKNELTRQARFAMDEMVRMVIHSRLLLLPQNDKPASNWMENVREETVPPTTPTDDSTKYTAVLAVTLPAYQDLDGDGFADADDDKDGLIDEDLPEDSHNDAAAGIYLIDDGGGGFVDEGPDADDDEAFFTEGEDPINGVDDDGDANIDEDPSANMNEDGCPGVCGVDDDADGSLDEGSVDDDDEDGQADEDWYNAVVFYLDTGTLKFRTPVPWDESGVGGISGRDFIISDLADNVTRFRVERVAGVIGGAQLLDLTLELTSPDSGEMVSLHTRVRLGGAL